MWLDFTEDQAKHRKQIFLRDWQTKLDQFLQFNDRDVLEEAGKISKKAADEKACLEYVEYEKSSACWKKPRVRKISSAY